jgi:spermidine synthase
MLRDASFPLVLLCFFLSGLAGLVYETAWTREFAFVFGTSHLAIATVLAAYMAGLASGAALAARFAHRIRRPVLAYGLLELGIGLAALAVPLAIRASRALYVGLFGGQQVLPEAGGLPTTLFYLICSFLILMVPTAMMGATLPLLARHAVRREQEIGSRIGLLYASNTAGAVAGTLLAAFVLLPALGLRQTIWIGALVNGAVFLAAWGLARSASPMAVAGVEERGRPRPDAIRWILPLIFGSGVLSFGYEVLWVRLLDHLLGGSVYAFATMLASFLTGIALGSALAARLGSTARRAALGFVLAQLCIAALSLAAFAGVGWIPELGAGLRTEGAPQQLVDAVASILTLFPAAVAIGATFPFAVRVLARREADAGPASARVYAANTLGSVVGAIGAGFFAVPALGYAGTLGACVAANLVLAAAAALLLEPRRPALAAATCGGLVLLASMPPATPWTILAHSPINRTVARGRVEYFGVGRTATVLLLDWKGRWFLRTNGLPEGAIDPPGGWHTRSPLIRWLVALPVLARPSARSLLMVGLGGGVALEIVPSTLERVDVVEIEPEVVAANRAIADRRWRDPLADPRLRLHLDDARNALLLTDLRFDAIVSQPSHPWCAGASHLYTREFFELAKSRLAPDGVFVQWVGFGFVDEALFRSLLATLTAVFENVRVYSPPPRGGALFIASDASLEIEQSAGRALEAAPAEFAQLGLLAPEDVTAWILLDEEGARELGRGAPLNRDAHNLLQSRSPRILDRSLKGRVEEFFGPLDPLASSRPPSFDPFYLLQRLPLPRAERLAARLQDPLDRRVAEALLELSRGELQRARILLLEVLREAPLQREARAALLRLSAQELQQGLDPRHLVEAPLDDVERAVAAGWRAHGAEDLAELRSLEPEFAAVPPRHPLAQEANRLRAEWRIAARDPRLAREAMEIADGALWDGGRPGDLLLRARACVAAGEPTAALEALALFASHLDAEHPLTRARALRGLRVARTIPADPRLERSRSRVERLLRERSVDRRQPDGR